MSYRVTPVVKIGTLRPASDTSGSGDGTSSRLEAASNKSARIQTSAFARETDSTQLDPRWQAIVETHIAYLRDLEPDTMGAGSAKAHSPRIATSRTVTGEMSAAFESLRNSARKLAPGDFLLVDFPGRTMRSEAPGFDRDEIGRLLFRAGFDVPLMFAGRDVLRSEAKHRPWLSRILPLSALGSGPLWPSSDADRPAPAADRIVAIARRSRLAPPDERTIRLSVVMPLYNEKPTFRAVMDRLLEKTIAGVEIEFCIVESNSTDGSRDDVLAYKDHPRVRLLLQDRPRGKGNAVRAGLRMATGDIVLIQDADLEYDIDDYEKLIDPIRRHETSFVLGSRHPAGENHWEIREFSGQRHISGLMNFGHLFFTWLLNLTFQQRLRDPFTMFKVFRRACVLGLHFECNRFDFDLELVGKLIRNGFSPREIDVHYVSRSFEEGKKVSFFGDPPTWIRACLKHRFSRMWEWPTVRR